MAHVTRVEVTLADVEPVARFIAQACKASAMIASMTAQEAAELPGTVAAGIAELQSAVRHLGGIGEQESGTGIVNGDDGEYVCPHCQRGQHGRCSDPECSCCLGEP